jgi:vacuolar-type H+-ATPase subunit H
MERDLLSKVLDTEREIQAKIESEKKRQAEKIEKARKEAEERVMREETMLHEQLEKSVREAKEIADEKAADILEAAVRRADNLRGLSDEALQRIVIKYIDSILPGRPIDRPNVKG